MPSVSDSDLEKMRTTYRQVRKLVYEEATRPVAGGESKHAANKAAMAEKIIKLCNNSSLCAILRMNPEAARDRIWYHLWSKIRYSGIRSAIASAEINSIQSVFNDLNGFSSKDWNVAPPNGKRIDVKNSGQFVRDFYNRSGNFFNCFTVRNPSKLRKSILVARKFNEFTLGHPNESPLNFLIGYHHRDDVWKIQRHLDEIGYRGGLTQLHAMMDIGFNVIKPDIVVSRLFLDWGWLHEAIPTLPKPLTRPALEGKREGNYGRKFLYTKPKMYRPIINLARQIVSGLNSDNLKQDIGWVTESPLREFDIFLVRFGQIPEAGWGIERRLADSEEIAPGVTWGARENMTVAAACSTRSTTSKLKSCQ